MRRGPPPIPLPQGFNIGDRIVTNEVYARVTPVAPGPRYGTIVAGSRSQSGPVAVLLDGCKYPRVMTLNLFDVVSTDSQ